VKGNADKLIQVFVNLLRNAVLAVPAGAGEICVASRRSKLGPRDAVSVTVEDNGPGIPAEVLPEIFDAFVTSRLDSRGTGLGLTVANGIVTQHDGAISASNRPGGGAVLEVTLPATEAVAKEASS
jgi:signal transduction histidine kinase